jgi:hypothetical protein
MMEPLSELERRHIEEQLGGARDELAQIREEIRQIRESIAESLRGMVRDEPDRTGPASD